MHQAYDKVVIGIDPGTGVSSPLGFAVFDIASRDILAIDEIYPGESYKQRRLMPLYKKIRSINNQIEPFVLMYPGLKAVYIESFVMRGKGGETLQRLVGGIMAIVPDGIPFREVANTRVKMIVGGKGSADKEQVAKGVLAFFSPNPESKKIIEKAIEVKAFDALDAFAIAIAGVSTHEHY